MAHESNQFLSDDDDHSTVPSGDATVNERVQELTWAMVDDEITNDEMRLLDSLLLSDDGARNTYVKCVQLHTDLLTHYADAAGRSFPGTTPVLGFLNEGVPPVDVQPTQQ